MSTGKITKFRGLVLIASDQLDRKSAVFDYFDRKCDVVLMVEPKSKLTRVPSHKARIAFHLSAMRHFRDDLVKDGVRVIYRSLEDSIPPTSVASELRSQVAQILPQSVLCICPSSYQEWEEMNQVAADCGFSLEFKTDNHFLCSTEWFEQYSSRRKSLRQEYFYREMRRSYNVLMQNGDPAGGSWNYDDKNRETFNKSGPGDIPQPRSFPPDKITKNVIQFVERAFPSHPGSLSQFDWPVTRSEALEALSDFIENRLPFFGKYQDAMWIDEYYLFHSRLSAALNLKLLRPLEVVRAAESEWQNGRVPLQAAEGFIRQILGWREFVRGVYWTNMPAYPEKNELSANTGLPWFYWTGETDMKCLRECLKGTLRTGYAHHIQRLMVTGLFALLLGVRPKEVHRWYLAIYVDALEWVEMPNTLGMSQFADGGIMASKPYAASGKYISRMSNYCKHCRYNPREATGDIACPFTTLYWDFLMRNEPKLRNNARIKLQMRNLDNLNPEKRQAIAYRATEITHQMT